MNEKDLLRNKNKKGLKYISIDTETENTNLVSVRPFEIAFITVENGKKVDEFQLFPLIDDLDVSPGAARVTGFKKDVYLKKAIDPMEVNEKLNEYLYNPEYLVVGQNLLNFDIYVLANFQKYLGLEPDFSFLDRVRDVYAYGKAIKMDVPPPDDPEDIVPWQYRITSTRVKGIRANLAQLCKDFNVDYDPKAHHEGIYDVKITHNVFQEMIYKMDIF